MTKLTETLCAKCGDSFGLAPWNKPTDVCPRCRQQIYQPLNQELIDAVQATKRRGILLAIGLVGVPVAVALLVIGFNWMIH